MKWIFGSRITADCHNILISIRLCADFTGSPNVVSVIKGTGGGKSIILNGHVDVVPEGDRNTWTVEPYSGEIKDGKLYGRGSTDMKGGNFGDIDCV